MTYIQRWSALFLVLASLVTFSFAQTTRGTVAGVVTDPSGAVVSGATVIAAPAVGGEARTTTTGSNGEYRIESLAPGEYTVSVQGQGFSKVEVTKLVVRTSLVTSRNVTLSPATSSESVTVEATADSIQTESGELSKTIPVVQIKDLPYASQNAYSLARTLPGVLTVANRDDFTNGTSFSVNGLRPRSNNFLIDGFDNNDNNIAGQAFQPNNTEAVQEVTVLTNSYTAEWGRGGGSVSNLTFRNGTNKFHGALWEEYAGSRLDALTSEQGQQGVTRVPQYVNNIFGFRLGGPILKNKLFFFGTSQWNRNFGASSFASNLQLPTAAGVATLQSLAATNPNAQIILNGLGNLRGVATPSFVNLGDRAGCVVPAGATQCAIEIGRFQRTDSTASISREWTVRADYSPSDKDNIFVRYTDSQGSFSPDLFANPTALPYRDTQQGGPSRILGMMWGHTFSPKVLNEFRASVQQIEFSFGPTPSSLTDPAAFQPTITIRGINTPFGGFSQGVFPQGRGHKTFQFQDAVSWNAGSHNIKIGADLAILLIRDQIPFNSNGAITFTTGGTCPTATTPAQTCTALANFLDNFTGTSGSLSKQFGNPRINVPTNQQAYYFQDSWKIAPNFTVDYGVRYEYQPPDASNVLPFPALDRAAFATENFQTRHEVKPDRNNWGPRVSFAYSPRFAEWLFGNNKTVLRGGTGIFYDAFFTNISNNTAAASPNTLGGTTNATPASGPRGIANPFTAVNAVAPSPSALNGVTSVDQNLRNPQIYQWNFNVQRELPAHFISEVAYSGSRGMGYWVNEQVNPRRPVAGNPRLFPTRNSVVIRGNHGDSNYHGLQTTVSRNVGNMSVRGSYTWSRSIDNMSEVFATSGAASRWQITNDPRSDRGPSAFHRKHRGSLAFVYEVPFPKVNGFLTAAFGGWSASGVFSWQSGTPETIYIGGWDQNGDGEAFNDRPTLGNRAVPVNYTPACLTSATVCSGVGFFDGVGYSDWNTGVAATSANQFRFIVNDALSGVNGNVTRNSFYFPGRQDYDLSVRKRFKMPYSEGHALEFRADMLNAFNHPNSGVDSLTGDINDTDFLNIDVTRRGGRSMVLWLKYSF